MELSSNSLRNWSIKHDIERKTIEGCLEYFRYYAIEDPEEVFKYFGEFDINLFNIKFVKVGLFIKDKPTKDSAYIASYAKIEYNNKYIGRYKLIFDLEGEILDDYWTDKD